jgi:hypothetical protein
LKGLEQILPPSADAQTIGRQFRTGIFPPNTAGGFIESRQSLAAFCAQLRWLHYWSYDKAGTRKLQP